jgi:Flp pilus assembly protein TadB
LNSLLYYLQVVINISISIIFIAVIIVTVIVVAVVTLIVVAMEEGKDRRKNKVNHQ